ncbi:MAG: helix-turn-helix transcriptional regulator [Clostridia bacterium]|nr:helix-turn-helix transcriptional regulator [Clostridia bacterium]
MANYGDKITILRKLNNMTQAELGKVLNVSYQAVSKWERNESEPDFETINTMCKLFNITLDNFVIGNFDKNEELKKQIKEDDLQKQQLGFCTICGAVVTEESLGVAKPKIICLDCCNNQKEEHKEREINYKNERIERQSKIKKDIVKKIILSSFLPILLLISSISSYTTNTYGLFGAITWGIVNFVWFFAFVYQLQTPDSPVRNALTKFFWLCVRLPGVIFPFSLDGILWLIGIKILFSIIGIVLALIAGLLGLAWGFFISIFTFPFTFMGEIATRKV